MFDFIEISLEKEDLEYIVSLLHEDAKLSLDVENYASARQSLNIAFEIQHALDHRFDED